MSGRPLRMRALRPRSKQQLKIRPVHKVGDNLKREQAEAESKDSVNQDFQNILMESEKAKHEQCDSEKSEAVYKPISTESTNTASSYECKMCKSPKFFMSLKPYMDHLKKEHKAKGKLNRDDGNCCSMCTYVARNPNDLEIHQRIHLKRRFFKCAKCSYTTHVRARYTKHVKYHSMPMIKCNACDFRTPYKWNLDRHTRNHGGNGIFQCQACDFTADIRQSLTVHETNHHEPPVGDASRKGSIPYERKLRNCPKRYNQVGASDFREVSTPAGITTISINSYIQEPEVNLLDEKRTSIADAECIALKCEEKGCQFVTAWDSEMQQHLTECHFSLNNVNKAKKPLPMLIPLSPVSTKSNNLSPTTLLKVPRVRVRPELAQIARDTEIAKLYGNKEVMNSRKINAADTFEKKNASFFDKLKEKLTTTTTINNGITEVAVSTTNDLKCWCTFEASSMEELALHKQSHHTALSVSVGTSRCPKCRRRCKSSTDLQVHMQVCHSSSNKDTFVESSTENITICSDPSLTLPCEESISPQLEWVTNPGGYNTSVPSMEGGVNTGGRRVFKCPHCPFWASTASRFHVHIVGHLNRKPFECSLCAYRSNWRWDITKHIKLKAVKDRVHLTARVLMTDETGRRNYSKYNKYLRMVDQNSWDEQNYEGRSADHEEELLIGEPPSKVLMLSNKDHLQAPKMTSTPISSLHINEGNNTSNLSLRPPPPLKAAIRSKGQSLLKSNSISSTVSITSPSLTNVAVDETKRSLWKCKRCNFRNSNKEIVLSHVKSHYEIVEKNDRDDKSTFRCEVCPFTATNAASLSSHRIHHRPNLEAIFKCYLCPYYVSTKVELLEHARLHGEELAVVHQQGVDSRLSSPNYRTQRTSSSENATEQAKSEIGSSDNISTNSSSKTSDTRSPLLLDTRALPDAPLVWVSRPDNTLAKMLKCRHCPYVSSRRAEVRDHETMHINTSGQGPLIACTDCSFTCSKKEVMVAHTDMHGGSLGTVHCLVDETRPDAQQLNDLTTLLGVTSPPVLGSEPDLKDSRLVHCCNKCPARFLCEKELRIHLRYHSTELAYSCQWCSYAARQSAHLLAHQKAHSSEYQDRTKYLLSVYGSSQRYPPPATACVETNEANSEINNVAWIVVEVPEISNLAKSSSSNCSQNTQTGSQVFTCAKCPARYFKLDALDYHMTLHGSNNRFRCRECDYSSKTAQNLVKHQVVHKRHNENNENIESRLQPPPDPQFGIHMRGNPNFVYPGYLRNGRLKEKRYKCHKCPSAFEKREQYRVHLTLHGAKQRYRCDTCDYSVKYYANYNQHLKKHQANAEAQASRRQYEEECTAIVNDAKSEETLSIQRSGKSLKSLTFNSFPMSPTNTASTSTMNCSSTLTSNQDKQSLILMQRKGLIASINEEVNSLRCQSCPFSTSDKDVMDTHKRRHGIERMTPSCPHCDYIPRKDENVSDHVKLHFTRLYKPESYLIIEMLTLNLKKISENENENENENGDLSLLFKECTDGRFLPQTESNSVFVVSNSTNTSQEKLIVDPHTGETKHRLFM